MIDDANTLKKSSQNSTPTSLQYLLYVYMSIIINRT